jgi:hypothetical protein
MAWLDLCPNLVANQILKKGMFSNNTAKHLVKEQINITTPFYNENFKYSHSILANISSTNGPFIIYTLGGVGDSYVI